MEKPVILCVDDERSVLNGLRDELRFELGNEYLIEIADSAEEGLRVIEELVEDGTPLPVIISDQLMPGMKGDEFLIAAHGIVRDTKKILLTGQAGAEAVGNAVNKAELYRYISKPWDGKDLVMTVKQAIESYFTGRELAARIKTLSDLTLSAQAFSEEIVPAALFDKILKMSVEQTEVTGGALAVYQTATPEYRCAENGTVTVCDGERLPLALFDDLLANESPVYTSKPRRESPWKDHAFIETRKIKAAYAAPIRKQGKTLALLFLYDDKKPDAFSPMKIEFLNVLIRQAATAIDNALLYQDLEEKVVERTREIELQKQIIEENNKDITDSIQYARRIQFSLMPPFDILSQAFPCSFVLYSPKDIVSGDFYWFSQQDDCFYVACADCTGHGVPGAFMSVLGSSLLNDVIRQFPDAAPSRIVTEIHRRVIENLSQSADDDDQVQDGMEIAVCKIIPSESKVVYSGANRPVVLVRNNQAYEYKTDKLPIGHSIIHGTAKDRQFSEQSFEYQAGDWLYIFTDGVTDQFGGPKGRKLSKRAFVEFLKSIQPENSQMQYDCIKAFIEGWQNSYPQTDDLLVIGILLK
jgi:serine phosphatase RsbU (regulator of sigma subunit)/CheY-like chemotaxis protein